MHIDEFATEDILHQTIVKAMFIFEKRLTAEGTIVK
jgi:hypothetical protein